MLTLIQLLTLLLEPIQLHWITISAWTKPNLPMISINKIENIKCINCYAPFVLISTFIFQTYLWQELYLPLSRCIFVCNHVSIHVLWFIFVHQWLFLMMDVYSAGFIVEYISFFYWICLPMFMLFTIPKIAFYQELMESLKLVPNKFTSQKCLRFEMDKKKTNIFLMV